jgi:dUTPase
VSVQNLTPSPDDHDVNLTCGERIAQIVFFNPTDITFLEGLTELSEHGGFGSTGA